MKSMFLTTKGMSFLSLSFCMLLGLKADAQDGNDFPVDCTGETLGLIPWNAL